MRARTRAPGAGAPRLAAVVAGCALLAVYGASAAPDVTFWDAGEFLSAFATFGIPHPPGTPLFVALGRTWTLVAGAFGVPLAAAGNLLASASTAGAGACTAWLVARWTGSAACGVAAAVCAGSMASIWSNATEAEVYALSLLLACLALVAGEHAGAADRRGAAVRRGSRGAAATAYALALAVPVHLSALVGAPAALWLACVPAPSRRFRCPPSGLAVRRIAALLSATVLAAGVGSARATLAVFGTAGLLAAVVLPGRAEARGRAPAGEPLAIAGAAVVALTATLVLLVRARHDPWLNQGDPSTWARLVDVLGRRQYAVAPLWPRQAPWWLQLANVGEWADWQVALGLAPGAEPSWRRTPVTLAFALLGLVGSAWHRRRDRRSWAAVLLLLGAGSVGVACYLNLKAGPSFGAGVLPATAPHEARERDYFFALAWWAWGLWAGLGAVVEIRRLTHRIGRAARPSARAAGLALAALPLALNWRAVSRARPPAARAAADYARALLENAPAGAVLFANGDNDTYPLWEAQGARAIRRDVTVVTTSLLPARWYRAELARRAALFPPEVVTSWLGTEATIAAVRDRAIAAGRPVVVTLATDDAVRAAARGPRGAWRLRGLTLARIPDSVSAAETSAARGDLVTLDRTLATLVGTSAGDRTALAAAAARAPRIAPAWLRDHTGDGVVAWAYRQLACPRAALLDAFVDAPLANVPLAGARGGGAADPHSLERPCQAR
ncbi:hypothetical protein tb265_28860 [Gemmatimonadetes bacterium T265]|nr:hypothetical protein tb265_28860 [Gemmatimonadetes bacterium T265]